MPEEENKNDKKETKSKEKLTVRKLNDVTEEEFRRRKCRLIVRNLSFLGKEKN